MIRIVLYYCIDCRLLYDLILYCILISLHVLSYPAIQLHERNKRSVLVSEVIVLITANDHYSAGGD